MLRTRERTFALLSLGSWQLPVLVCNLYVFLDVLLCTTSIWHLTIVSIDRFLHISRPFRSRKRSKMKTFVTILGIWTFSIAISCTILILGFTDQKNILITVDEQRRYCNLNNRSFIIYGSIICFCVPCILMLVTYSLTIRLLQKEAAKCYSDPDEHHRVVSRTSDRLRRHRSSSKRRTQSCSHRSASPSREMSSTASIPSPSSPRSATILEVSSTSNHLEWP